MRFFTALLMLMASASLFSQEDCNLFNIQDLAAENLALHDSIAQFSVDSTILQSDGSVEVYLSNGTTYTQVQGCTDAVAANYDPAANTDDGSCSSCSSIEFDGYTYSAVEIGDQCWFAENLRTTVYADGSAIPEVTDDATWSGLSTGARSDYDNAAYNALTYGRLYNWYAVNNGSGLCPSGWHVPTDGEWTALETYLGAGPIDQCTVIDACGEGTALKSTTGWYDNGNGTDNFWFSALPGGFRFDDGNGFFDYVGYFGIWWSSSPSDGYAWSRNCGNANPGIYRHTYLHRFGFSVRCLRDAD